MANPAPPARAHKTEEEDREGGRGIFHMHIFSLVRFPIPLPFLVRMCVGPLSCETYGGPIRPLFSARPKKGALVGIASARPPCLFLLLLLLPIPHPMQQTRFKKEAEEGAKGKKTRERESKRKSWIVSSIPGKRRGESFLSPPLLPLLSLLLRNKRSAGFAKF